MDRRSCVGRSASLLGEVALGVGASPNTFRTRRLTRIGLELWTVRDVMKRDPEGTLGAIRDIGFTDVELLWTLNNFSQSTEQVKATLARLGLRAPSAHI